MPPQQGASSEEAFTAFPTTFYDGAAVADDAVTPSMQPPTTPTKKAFQHTPYFIEEVKRRWNEPMMAGEPLYCEGAHKPTWRGLMHQWGFYITPPCIGILLSMAETPTVSMQTIPLFMAWHVVFFLFSHGNFCWLLSWLLLPGSVCGIGMGSGDNAGFRCQLPLSSF